MFEASVATELLGVVVDGMRSFPPATDDGSRVDQLTLLEQLKSAVCAAQAELAAGLVDDAPAGTTADVPAHVRSAGAQVGLARRESPYRGRDLVGLGVVLTRDLPRTMAELRAGRIDERRASIVARESADLEHDDRLLLDADVAPRLGAMGDRETLLAVQRAVLRIDQDGAVRRRERAHARRSVTGRRLPHGMGQITAVVSDSDYHAVMSSLDAAVDRRHAAGQQAAAMTAGSPDHVAASAVYADRTKSQLKADEFVARLTGATVVGARPVRVNLVMSAQTLLGGDDEPADLVDAHGVCGPIPASVARRMVADAAASTRREITAQLRRLFTFPGTDTLVAMEAATRTFDGLLAEFLRLRDQVCRTPWCNGRVRHGDHVRSVPVAARPPPATARACASRATTRRKPRVGDTSRTPTAPTASPTTRSRSPPPRATDIAPVRPVCPGRTTRRTR